MPDRLAELRRQRALLQEHLAWLDAEITRETTASTSTTMPSPLTEMPRNPFGPLPSFAASALAPQPSTASAATSATASGTPGAKASAATPTPISAAAARASPTAAATPEIDAMLDEYRVPPMSVRTDVRKGCFVYFAAALALVALIVTVLYFALTPR